jgi:Sec-independent protein translocase protein TatA
MMPNYNSENSSLLVLLVILLLLLFSGKLERLVRNPFLKLRIPRMTVTMLAFSPPDPI